MLRSCVKGIMQLTFSLNTAISWIELFIERDCSNLATSAQGQAFSGQNGGDGSSGEKVVQQGIKCKEISHILTFKNNRKIIRKKLGLHVLFLYLCSAFEEKCTCGIRPPDVVGRAT